MVNWASIVRSVGRTLRAGWDKVRRLSVASESPARRRFQKTSRDVPDSSSATQSRDGQQALKDAKRNAFKSWNRSTSSKELSSFPSDASRRIFDDFAALVPTYTGPKLHADSAVFTMGSCFAREIEAALVTKGGNVISVDNSIDRDEFKDPTGKVRNGFFHRFTPPAMSQEFQACFDELPGWSNRTLIFPLDDDRFIDLNYWQVAGADESGRANDTRRAVAKSLVCRAVDADIIILTLGLTEAWLHKPTGFFANFTTPQFLARHIKDFELHLIGVDETVQRLRDIDAVLKNHHSTGRYQIVVTVSPVPLSATFTDKDIIVANMDSKSTLRAAATAFVAENDHAHYFPSYEMVTYSDVRLAWRPDRVHVKPRMVSHIVSAFTNAYYEEGALS
jgi:hypothetical protein